MTDFFVMLYLPQVELSNGYPRKKHKSTFVKRGLISSKQSSRASRWFFRSSRILGLLLVFFWLNSSLVLELGKKGLRRPKNWRKRHFFFLNLTIRAPEVGSLMHRAWWYFSSLWLYQKGTDDITLCVFRRRFYSFLTNMISHCLVACGCSPQ